MRKLEGDGSEQKNKIELYDKELNKKNYLLEKLDKELKEIKYAKPSRQALQLEIEKLSRQVKEFSEIIESGKDNLLKWEQDAKKWSKMYEV